ncbi:putative thiol oxidase [Lupinus albus]|uniref:Putative thiol oxidase n=1 Tax=Lupinus albus TaxID=3870 RepID=A0A6A4NBP4_LUPAL|nr:putative thiol oxidase [Lupinus albus]
MYSYLGLFLCILFVCCSATPFTIIGSRRSILREINNNDKSDHPDYAVELNATNFDDVLKDTPATFAVVEFFAHWCPACRNYKPHYEKVARLFNGPDAVHPGIILMTRVDCASKVCASSIFFLHNMWFRVYKKHALMIGTSLFTFSEAQINNKLCDQFSVVHYPMLFWGRPPKFVGGSWEPKQEKSDICVIDDACTADRLLNWINKELGSSFGLDDQRFGNEHLSSNISDPGQIVKAIYDVEEATSTAFDIILGHKMIKPESRASLIKFLQLLVVHHPSKRCRKGSAEFLMSFDDLYPADFWSTNEQEINKGSLSDLQICGKDLPHGQWIFCRGSKNDTRGFR